LFTSYHTALRELRIALKAALGESRLQQPDVIVRFLFRRSSASADLQVVASGICPFSLLKSAHHRLQSRHGYFLSGVLGRTISTSIGPLPVQRVQLLRFVPKYFKI
jgi:hypothetical protein